MNGRTRKSQENQIYHPPYIQIRKSPVIHFLAAVLLILSGAGLANEAFSATASPITPIVQPQEARRPDRTYSIRSQAPTELSNTRWFCILCGCAVGVLLWQLYRLQLDRNTVQSQSRAAGIREERERIARELHDTLIQSVHALILTLQASTAGLPKTDRLRNEIDSALDRAGDLLDEARDRVSGLRGSMVPLDVARAISNSANMLSAAKPANFKLSVSGSPRPLQQKAAEHIYALTREAVANAFTHANAKTIEVEIGYETKLVRVHVRDDGRGVGSVARIQSNASRHFGLQGMRERAAQMRGHLTIWSREGAGTEIALDVPATSAYLSSALADRSSPKFRAVVAVAHGIAGRLTSSRKNIAGAAQ